MGLSVNYWPCSKRGGEQVRLFIVKALGTVWRGSNVCIDFQCNSPFSYSHSHDVTPKVLCHEVIVILEQLNSVLNWSCNSPVDISLWIFQRNFMRLRNFFFRNFYRSIKYTSCLSLFAITRFLCFGSLPLLGQLWLMSWALVGQTCFGTGFSDKPVLGWDKPVWGIIRCRVGLMFKVMRCRAWRYLKNS